MSVTYNAETGIINVDEFLDEDLSLQDLYNRKSQLEAGLLVKSNIDKQAQTDLENKDLAEDKKKEGRIDVIQAALDRTNAYILEAEKLGAKL